MRWLSALLAVMVVGAGCATGSGGQSRTVTVFAAASLAETFGVLERRFEQETPGVDVRLVLGGSSRLAQQLDEGARADIFASADEKNMDKAVRAGRISGPPNVFATNTLTIAVEPGNPEGITSFADLAKPGLTVVRCAPQVPCGSATDVVARRTGVAIRAASEELDVKAVLAKVVAGEADAGLVYVTDAVAASESVGRVDFPEADDAVNRYPIGAVEGAADAELARRFIDLVLRAEGQRVLRQAGFGAP